MSWKIDGNETMLCGKRAIQLCIEHGAARRISVNEEHGQTVLPSLLDGDHSVRRTHGVAAHFRGLNHGPCVPTHIPHQRPCAFLMISAARSPMTTHGAIVLPLGTLGMIEESAILNRPMP